MALQFHFLSGMFIYMNTRFKLSSNESSFMIVEALPIIVTLIEIDYDCVSEWRGQTYNFHFFEMRGLTPLVFFDCRRAGTRTDE